MTTAFCGAEVTLWDDLAFHIDGNSKITASSGSFAEPVPNAFSLPAPSTCPHSTRACRASCYVNASLVNLAPEVASRFALNAMALTRLLPDWPRALDAAQVLATWIGQHCSEFRWHVSGDVFSNRYAQWIAEVCTRAPLVNFWIYTRSFGYVPTLLRAPNLVVNLSADCDNIDAARAVSRSTGARLCYLAQDADPHALPELPEGSVIFPDYQQRGRALSRPTDHSWWRGLSHEQRRQVCPADFFGQSESNRCGPCRKCMVR